MRWPLLLPLALTLGAALYMTAPSEPGWPLLMGITGPALILWALARRRRAGLMALALGVVACAGLGAVSGKARTLMMAAPVLREEIGPVRIEGVIAEIDASERSRRIRLAVRAIEGLAPDATPEFVRFSYRGEIPFAPGRAVACRAILSPPPRPVVPGDYEFHRDAWFQKLGAVGFAVGACEPLPSPPPANLAERISYWIGAVRRALAGHVYEEAGERGGGMSAAMVAGDRSFITPEDSEALRLSGLAHLLSISGVHMVLAGGIVFFFIRYAWPIAEPLALRVPAVKAAAFGAVVACTLYFIVSGMEVATQRAYVMALIAFGAKLFDRPALSLRSVAVALFAVVLLQPESVVSPGFQMSFAASAALIALYEIWPKLDRPEQPSGMLSRVGPWIVGTVATSFTASMATMPFALYHFDRAAVFSVIANIVSTPVITLWTTPAAAMAAIAAPFGLDEPFLALMGKSLEVVLAIAHWSVEASPDVSLPRMNAAGLGWAAAAIVIFCIASRRGRWLALAPFGISLALWLTGPAPVGYVATDGSVFLKAERGWLELIDWRVENGLNPLIIGDEIAKAPCKGAGCAVDAPAGRWEVAGVGSASGAPAADTPSDGAPGNIANVVCPSAVVLRFTRPGGGGVQVQPCDYVGRGGAVLELGGGVLRVRTAPPRTGRAWEAELW